jgi:hypothetical protein
VRTPTGDATPLDVLTELSTALTARGLRVEVDRKIWSVTAQNPAAKDLRQVVRLGGKDGEPTWFWEWSGPHRDSPPEFEPMCPAHAIAEATERVTRVLAVRGRE